VGNGGRRTPLSESEKSRLRKMRERKGERLALAVSKHERSCWLRGHSWRESGKHERDLVVKPFSAANGDGYGGGHGSQSCGNLSCR